MGRLNRAEIIGTLGRDPEARTFPDGGKVVNIRCATSEKWRDRSTGEEREATEWHNVAIFGPLADIAERYLRKGSTALFVGKLRTRKWQDQSGADRYSTEIALQGPRAELELLDGKGPRDGGAAPPSGGAGGSAAGHGHSPAAGIEDDEIPF